MLKVISVFNGPKGSAFSNHGGSVAKGFAVVVVVVGGASVLRGAQLRCVVLDEGPAAVVMGRVVRTVGALVQYLAKTN